MNSSALLCIVHLYEMFSSLKNDGTFGRWSDITTWNGSPPEYNANVTITNRILLDVEPPTLWSITIKAGGALVWDPAISIHLKVHWIQVDGELHIGSKDCPFETKTRITFLGNVNENDLGAGGDKALFVTAGGTLEIHGKPKLSWTKLDKTAEKLGTENGLHILQKDIPDKRMNRGLIVYVIDPTTAEMTSEEYFNFNVHPRRLPAEVDRFVKYLNDIADGQIVGIAVKRIFAPRADATAALDAIDAISGLRNSLRGSTGGAAYALITKKGSHELSVESLVPWYTDGTVSCATVANVFGDLYVSLKSYSHQSFRGNKNYVLLNVADDLVARPILTLVDQPFGWEQGDKIIIASTDYDWRQAEEKTTMTCDSSICNSNQVRLSDSLMNTHYGEIYKNVDMRGEVGLLSRNILFDTEDAEGSTTYGGNLKVLKGFKSVHIEGAEFNDLGQREVLGRYPIHFHMCEDVDSDEATRPWLKHNSIHHSNSRCVTVHGTHGLIVEDNVCYLTHGHGYFLEDGGEKRTVFDGNLGLGQERGSLIKADKRPSTFWITNPQSYVRNNAAAGGDGRGYWYTYPRVPLAPSDDKGFMLKDEARHTAIYEFENNVAHSYRNHGIFVDNEFLPNTDATGYNRYRPKEDPIMHLKYKNSTDKPAIFNRLTAYKNSPRNAWIRGGMIKVTHASLSDSPVSMNLVKENKAIQFLESSVIIGDSPNVGQVAVINNEPVSIGRSFPKIRRSSEFFLWRSGITFQKGPVFVKDVFFDGFANNEYYSMGALGFRGLEMHSPLHNVINAKFGFSDPAEGNRVQIPVINDDAEQTMDDMRTFRDVTHSVTGDSSTSPVSIVMPEAFHMTDSCAERTNWNMAYCRHNYGKISVRFAGDDNVMWATRDDDYLNARIDVDNQKGSPFLAILGGAYSYSVYWGDEVPSNILIRGIGVTKSEGVRVGVCLPPNAEFQISARYPSRQRANRWTTVNSIQDVDDKGEYFYDAETGYFSVYLTHDSDFVADEAGECPGGNVCSIVLIKVTKGDLTATDCLDAVHTKFDLSPGGVTVAKRSVPSITNLLSGQLQRDKRSLDGSVVIPSTGADPPAGWGAGPTRGGQ